MCACGAFRPTDRTPLVKMRAVRNPVCDAPKASSAKKEHRSNVVMPDTVYNFVWQMSRCLARQAEQSKTRRRVDTTDRCQKFTKMNHFSVGECDLRLWRDTVMVPSGHWKGKLARVYRCQLVRRPENQHWDRKAVD